MELRLVPISSLLLHERTVPAMVDSLIAKLVRDGSVRDPVMADSASLVILDGMHRVTALAKMGCRRVPTCLLPYAHPSISVRCWYRALTGPVSSLVGNLPRRSEWSQGAGTWAVTIRSPETALSLSCGRAEDAYSLLEEVEGIARRNGLKVGYEVEEEAEAKLRSNAVSAIIAMPPLAKEDVIRLANQRKLLPPKSTRHVFPARPVELNLPLGVLKVASDSEAQAKFDAHLAKRVARPAPSDAPHRRRRYGEELYILS